jgi:valyl-tRNA synthetase
MLDKTFQPSAVEPRLYDAWERAGIFAGGQLPTAEPFCLMIPPPNVTGSLHMGHALNNTLQDVLARYQRLRGRDVLWQPGMDHAGIATQMVVERQLMERQEPDRRAMGRDAFIDRVWQWKEESGGMILNQLRRLGASCDWSRSRFTMDEGMSRAVLHVFVRLYREGLIYRDKRLVNWDPKLLTAISDLEVVNREVKGHLWHFNYPIEGEDGRFITVATTRPETMLGDTAVAVHPDDERYRGLVGKYAILPLVGRRIPIVADEYADPGQGSGAVKITPAHDFNDFEVGRRHNLDVVNIFDAYGNIITEAGEETSFRPATDGKGWLPMDGTAIVASIPEALRGQNRDEGRRRVVGMMEEKGLLEKIEDRVVMVPYGDRSDAVIEPRLTDQWYVDAATLAKPAIEAVERGDVRFVPENWARTYFEWMRNIQPWCISRQLWWGHQIPVWYGPDNTPFCAETEEEAQLAADQHYGERVTITRDPDVLDTWFSSALWPFATLGWPEKTPALERFYPSDVLVTGFDIIFFWVARMMMMGLHLMQAPPFHTVYIHALVRDEKGQKMSKSRGNVVDPIELIDEYGADALRFTLTAMAAQGRDVKLSKSRVEGYRNFGTKLWNAARFCEMNECVLDPAFDPASVKQTVNRWILSDLARLAGQVETAIESYRFNEAAGALYHFVWHVFCDWYVEFSKPHLAGRNETVKAETRATAAYVLDHILILLHPVMPFLTEELWQRLAENGPARKTMLAAARWPALEGIASDAEATSEMEWIIRVVSDIRSVRAEMNVPAAAKIPLIVSGAGPHTLARLNRHDDLIKRLARLEWIHDTDEVPAGSVQMVIEEASFALPLADVIDMAEEIARLSREISRLDKEIARIDAKLGNENFLQRAPEEVIEEQRGRRAEYESGRARLAEAQARLKAAG